jgi:hypothetical protein
MRLSVPPPLPSMRRAPPKVDPIAAIDASWDDDENEEAKTDVYVERATLELKRDAFGDDESTHEIPQPTLPRLPELRAPSAPSVPPSPPSGFEKLSRSLAAASLAPVGFATALAHENANVHRSWLPPPRLALPSIRVGWAVGAAVVVGLIAFAHKPPQGTIVVDATDTRGAPVHRFEVQVDGQKTLCNEAPCSVPSAKGLHEVKVVADGLDVPATQAVVVASNESAAAHFIVAAAAEPATKAVAPQDEAKPAVESNAAASAPTTTPVLDAPISAPPPSPAPAAARIAPAPRQAPASSAPAAPAAPAAKASPERTVSAAAPDGYLNINSIPASSCFVDGKALGSTPRLRVEVSAGSHSVKFRAPDGSATKTVVVRVGAGETRLAVARLR